MEQVKVRIKNIEWCVDYEDVYNEIECDDSDNIPSELVEERIKLIKGSLPTECVLKVKDVNDIADILSDKYNWLVNSFTFECI